MTQFLALTNMLKVPDIRSAVGFYCSIGFELQGTDEFHYGEGNVNWAMLQNGDASLMLSVGGDSKPKQDIEMFLRVVDADAFHDSIKDKVDVISGPEDQFYGVRDFWFVDPFGFRWGAGHVLETKDGDNA